jgi:hypothetical protein
MLCTERSLVKHGSNTLSVRPLRCKRWSCEHCYPRRARDLWHKAFNGQPDMFLTLTMKPDAGLTPEQAAVEFVEGWRMLRQFLCRKLDRKGLTFLAVFEAHESGWPHLHILLRSKYIDHRVIRSWWESRTGSYQIDIRRVHNPRQRASYVSKYVAKRPTQFGSCKRFWCSQDWDPPAKEPDPNQGEEVAWWEAITVSPAGMMAAALAAGAKCTWKGDLLVIEQWHWRDRHAFGVG